MLSIRMDFYKFADTNFVQQLYCTVLYLWLGTFIQLFKTIYDNIFRNKNSPIW